MTKSPIVFMFSGQGSQYYQMGKELYETQPRFKLWMDHCNEIAQSLINESIIDIIYEQGSKSDSFDRILHSNPALVSFEYSLARFLMEQGISPDCLLGYSLGEVAASVVAGVISLDDGMKLAVESAKLLEDKAQSASMLAILDSEEILFRYPTCFRDCHVAGRNFQGSFVIVGRQDHIENLQKTLLEKNITFYKLPINYGFHSSLMDPLENEFKQLARKVNFSDAAVPVVSSLTTSRVEGMDYEHLWKVMRFPVEFEKTITTMVGERDHIFIDVGPSGTLSTFIKYLLPSSSNSLHFEVINQFGKDLDSLQKVISYFIGNSSLTASHIFEQNQNS